MNDVNVFINVIGWGDVRLTELEHMHIGKVAVVFDNTENINIENSPYPVIRKK